MRANELKKGNCIQDNDGFIFQVNGITITGRLWIKSDLLYLDKTINPALYYPIQLTEDWLLKFGFEKFNFKENIFRINIDSVYAILITGFNCWIGYIDDSINDIQLMDVSTVHQLQNLYFALTGKELEIK